MTKDDEVLYLARRFLFVREIGGPNCGPWVEAIQAVTRNRPPDSWCASFVSCVLGLAFQGKPPLPPTASCDVLLEHARGMGYLTSRPLVADVFLVLRSPQDAHHAGFVTRVQPGLVGTISGNTSADGLSSNGDRVAEHDRVIVPAQIVFVHYPREVAG